MCFVISQFYVWLLYQFYEEYGSENVRQKSEQKIKIWVYDKEKLKVNL